MDDPSARPSDSPVAQPVAIDEPRGLPPTFPLESRHDSPGDSLRPSVRRFCRENAVPLGLIALYAVWAIFFIVRWSHVGALTGTRHFVLFDDGMITMRYAQNLVEGHGLVWNPGERVEGFSNPAMLVVMAVLQIQFQGDHASLAVQVVGLLTMTALAVVTWRLALAVGATGTWTDRALPTVGVAATLGFYLLSEWTLRGMEPGLMALAIGLSLLAVVRHDAAPRRWGVVLAVSAGVVVLSRPEGIAIAGLLVVWAWWRQRVLGKGPDVKRLVRLAAPALVVLVLFEAFRLAYYGQWLPNTYTLKMGGIPFAQRISNGLAFSAPQLVYLLPLAVPVLATGRRILQPDVAIGPALMAAFFAVQVWVGGDFLPRWRMVAPAMPFFLLAVGTSLLFLLSRWNLPSRRRVVAVGGALVAVAALTALNWAYLPEARGSHDSIHWRFDQLAVDTAEAMSLVLHDNASLAVFTAGIIPYQTGLYSIDMLGKTDAYIAGLPPRDEEPPRAGPRGWVLPAGMTYWPGHNKYDLNHSVKEALPTYSQGFLTANDDLVEWAFPGRYVIACIGDVILALRIGSPDVDWNAVLRLGMSEPCTFTEEDIPFASPHEPVSP